MPAEQAVCIPENRHVMLPFQALRVKTQISIGGGALPARFN